ncbi:Rieske 2Fe-2S domain-containing protein [Allocoleopsis franciscana]|uniref:Ferredoxin subunit of nitrite reductase and ring-hydroxylating dioxygenase n=1 Tax=Allocoleopsis franciscana PCC 7113 TaxID=1173027 RepID=K9WJ48_9CYAN|nr:Rieske 2Fe-2S domain-containing protein [Allocoleopsis franciscana]AFZ19836.1 ferredoxin subunit of nitrite reductase and ring-hydroxylating dioxygenase [Allocoleopsis franciscana PCC 7113]
MTNLSLTAKSIGFEHIHSIPLHEINDRVMRGEIVVMPKCLQAMGYFERLKEATLEAICQAVGEAKAAQVRSKGFEAIHEIINLDELVAISNSSYDVIRSLAPGLSKAVVKEIFQRKQPFYFEESPNVRFHIPYDVVVERKKEFSQFHWNGKVTAHGPHHDSWYQCPTNCVNIWIAIGSVKIGNGLSIYPQVYGKRLPCTEDGKILRDQYFGSVLNFDLEPGDALIFHGEHLHSSELNSTDATRYVVSLRMTLEKPKFLGQSPYKSNYIYSETNDGLAAACNQVSAKISRRFIKQLDSHLNRSETPNYVISALDISIFDNTSADFPKPPLVKTVEGTSQDKTKLIIDSTELAIGTIKPVSQTMCVARVDENRVVAFSRHCPHEGADLAGGYLRDGCVVCPWHNLPLNIETGASPCKSLSQLKVFDCVESDGTVEIQG